MRTAPVVIAIDWRAVRGIDRGLEGADLGKQPLLTRSILSKCEGVVDRRRADIVEADAMPRFESRKPPAGIVCAADDHRDDHKNGRETGTSHPAPERGHGL